MRHFELVLGLLKPSKIKNLSSPAGHGGRHFRSVSQAVSKKNLRPFKLRNNFDYDFVILQLACEENFTLKRMAVLCLPLCTHYIILPARSMILLFCMKQSYLLSIVLKTYLDN